MLHAAVACSPSVDVVKFLIEEKPSLPSQTNKRGQLPYHNGLNAGAMPEVLDVVLEVSCPRTMRL